MNAAALEVIARSSKRIENYVYCTYLDISIKYSEGVFCLRDGIMWCGALSERSKPRAAGLVTGDLWT